VKVPALRSDQPADSGGRLGFPFGGDEIVGVASIVGLQAIEYRKLYPVEENS